MNEDAAALVALVAEKSFGGILPPCPSIIVAACVAGIPVVRDAPEAAQQEFADAMAVAIADHLTAARVAEAAEFLA